VIDEATTGRVTEILFFCCWKDNSIKIGVALSTAVKLGDRKAVFITSDRKRLGEFPRFLGREQKMLEIR
jgi:hypothetical protein